MLIEGNIKNAFFGAARQDAQMSQVKFGKTARSVQFLCIEDLFIFSRNFVNARESSPLALSLFVFASGAIISFVIYRTLKTYKGTEESTFRIFIPEIYKDIPAKLFFPRERNV